MENNFHVFFFCTLFTTVFYKDYSLPIQFMNLSQSDLQVYRSETLPDAPEVAGNLDGLYCNLYQKMR